MIVTKVKEIETGHWGNSGGGERLPEFLLSDLGIHPRSAYSWYWDSDKFGVVVVTGARS